jgi:hypothetical protein
MTEEETIKKLEKEIRALRLQREEEEKFLGPNWGVPIVAIGFAILFWVNDLAGVVIVVIGFLIEYRLRKRKKAVQMIIKDIDQKIKRKSMRVLELKKPE